MSNKSICQNILANWNFFKDISKNKSPDEGRATFSRFEILSMKNKKGAEKLKLKHIKSDVFDKNYIKQKCFCLKIYFFMFSANFSFVLSNFILKNNNASCLFKYFESSDVTAVKEKS